MTPQGFKIWRDSLGLSQQDAADILGITRRGIQKREAEEYEIGRETEFACLYLTAHPEIVADLIEKRNAARRAKAEAKKAEKRQGAKNGG